MEILASFLAIRANDFDDVKNGMATVLDIFDETDSEEDRTFLTYKTWHGIHFLLTGRADSGPKPWGWVVWGDKIIGEDLGFDHGPARYLTAQQAKTVSQALDTLSFDDLIDRFDPARMTALKIYPGEVWNDDSAQALTLLLTEYRLLAQFYRDAAERNDAVVMWLS